MREAKQKLGFVGFTFNGIHSSQFGLYSVTSGGRYARQMLPNSEDITLSVEGGNGSYFFGSKDKEKTFKLDLAFMDMTEQEYIEMITWLRADGVPKSLILDERPYVQYYVKLSKEPQIKFVPFDYENFGRIYKGELELEFKAYDPYGYSVHKFLNEYVDEDPYSIGEWAEGSKLLGSNNINGRLVYDVVLTGGGGDPVPIWLYNAGDLPTDFILTIPIDSEMCTSYSGASKIYLNGILLISINITGIVSIVDPSHQVLEIHSQKRLVKLNGVIRNDLVVVNALTPIPIGRSVLTLNDGFCNGEDLYSAWSSAKYAPSISTIPISGSTNWSITGEIAFDSLDEPTGAIVELYNSAGYLLSTTRSNDITVGAPDSLYGFYDVPNGCYFIKARKPHFVSHPIVFEVSGANLIKNINIYSGDVNLDGVVDSIDRKLLLIDYNSPNSEHPTFNINTDLNKDGNINSTDLSLWSQSNGQSNSEIMDLSNLPAYTPVITYKYKYY